MKNMLMYSLILLGLFNNISSMEEERNLGGLEALPNEIRYEIIKSIIEDNINNWGDIFNFDNESLKNDLDRVRLISKDFTVFGKEELENPIKKLKDERSEYLKENIKGRYKGISEEKLNKKLAYLLRYRKGLKNHAMLIIAGANIDTTDKYGMTTLMLAADTGHIKIVKLLIKMGPDINITNNNGWTALMHAARNNKIEAVKLLIDKGAKIGATNNNGWTALMKAAWNGHIEVVRLLIEKGAKIDATNNNGDTALMKAARNNKIEVVRLLIGKRGPILILQIIIVVGLL